MQEVKWAQALECLQAAHKANAGAQRRSRLASGWHLPRLPVALTRPTAPLGTHEQPFSGRGEGYGVCELLA